MTKIQFNDFCQVSRIAFQKKKIDSVILIIWYHQKISEKTSISITEINNYLKQAHLPEYNRTRLSGHLKIDKRITKGENGNYKLNRAILEELDKTFNYLFEDETKISLQVSLNNTPFLDNIDIDNAHKMAELYLIIFCFENSARRFVAKIFSENYGDDWWNKIKNADFKKKVEERISREQKLKWICQRGTSPLFYLDWSDLLKIIRKYEDLFTSLVADLKFIELRFEELERVRNIIAHNGVIPDKNDVDRLILYFQDWCKQLNKI
ncbi:Swt1 family HEPN domain-containing protein [Coprobacter tertius]|uniref:Swt1 family HEPN domain-containing protein n=1 Tax=Coprobacter tertius TaxID=2944915 RepID=A0ABT1MLJ5_9BACT|nr:Swt1 family HEPN domain-containing protein [Coprobacter tertius]MCP9612761.1 Swt1 family HEPN domain-containing protein [Coprobacter tertius]